MRISATLKDQDDDWKSEDSDWESRLVKTLTSQDEDTVDRHTTFKEVDMNEVLVSSRASSHYKTKTQEVELVGRAQAASGLAVSGRDRLVVSRLGRSGRMGRLVRDPCTGR